MPALVNIRVGSFLTTIGAEGTMVCPLAAKKSKKALRMSNEVIMGGKCYICRCRNAGKGKAI